MIEFIIIMVLLVIVVKCVQNKIIIRFDTLFRKGFKKYNDKYGVFCWVGKQR